MIRCFEPSDEDALVELWHQCGLVVPWNDPRRDIDRKRAADPSGLLVAADPIDERLLGSVMAGYDGHRGWINYLAVAPSHRTTGLGRALMAAAEALLAERGCPKVSLQIRSSNTEVVAFYETLGYSHDRVVSMGKRLIADE